MSAARVLSFSLFLLVVALAGCQSTRPKDDSAPGRSPSAKSDGGLPAMDDGADPSRFLGDLLIFLGADRPPSRALREIREVHDLRTWNHRLDVPDAVGRCREAVRDLGRSDYTSWDDTAIAIWVLSTMAVRDPASLVRDDAIGVLAQFRAWVHKDAAAMGPGVESTEAEVADALKTIQSLHTNAAAPPGPAARLKLMDAIAVLGSYPWDRMDSNDPAVIRTRLSRPRGVIRFLTAPGLSADRKNPLVADTLDRALLRVSDEVLFLSELSGLADRSSHVRTAAADALGKAGDPRAARPLARTLRGEDRDEVKLAIAGALASLPPLEDASRHAALAALAERLSDADPSVRRAAARAMGRLTGVDRGEDPAVWRRWWEAGGEETSSR